MWVSYMHTRALARVAFGVALVLVFAACSEVDEGLLAMAEQGDAGDGDDGTGSGGFDNSRDANPDGGFIAPGDAAVDGPDPDECTPNPDAEEAPTCERDNADATCFEGDCFIVACLDGHRDCNLDTADGCEVLPTDPQHCGSCNQACSRPGAVFECVDDSCVYAGCDDGYADCDMDEVNGCEVDVRSTANCGACGTVCPVPPMGAPACIAGLCDVGECMPGFGNCDGLPDNGCEQLLNTDDHCAACGSDCRTLPDATGRCETDTCVVDTCEGAMVDCNGIGSDGCETEPDSPNNCGGCGMVCDLPGTEVHGCDAGACNVDHSCPGGLPACEVDAPEAGCDDGYADCDMTANNGCEAYLGDVEHCGSCDNDCVIPNSIPACNAGACEVAGCDLGYDQCVPGGPCISLLDDDGNCGGCGDACDLDQKCAGGVCSIANCTPGTADCDGDPGNQCETDLGLPDNCGGCGIECGPYANASDLCAGGMCSIDMCLDPYADCDGIVGNGCEVDISSLEDCGSCGNDCTQLPGVDDAQCAGGDCEIVTCTAGQADCDPGAAGCETNIELPTNCGSCGNDCSALPNTLSVGCNAGTCEFSCQDGFADCDLSPGCETDLTALGSCGSCGNDCSGLANVASAACVDGACADITCTSGFEDCDQLVFTGCEQGTTDTQNCGGCAVLCAPPGATNSSCPGGVCEYVCGGTLKDCNGDPYDGCERDTASDNAHCGGCNQVCNGVCENGVCSCATDDQCGSGETCCGGTCSALTDRNNCGACGAACLPWLSCTSGCCRSSPWSPCGF